jgi:hypothetical protein
LWPLLPPAVVDGRCGLLSAHITISLPPPPHVDHGHWQPGLPGFTQRLRVWFGVILANFNIYVAISLRRGSSRGSEDPLKFFWLFLYIVRMCEYKVPL